MRFSEPSVQKRGAAIEIFRRFDPKSVGFVTNSDFIQIYNKLVDVSIITQSYMSVDDSVAFLSQNGRISCAKFVAWIENFLVSILVCIYI